MLLHRSRATRETGSRRPAHTILASLPRRLIAGVSVGLAAYLLFQLIRIAAEASGLCTGCNSADQADVLGAASLGGGAVALGGDAPDEDGNWFEQWWNRSQNKPRGVEAVNAPGPGELTPEQEETEQWERRYRQLVGPEGLVEPEEGSVGAELDRAIGRFFDFATGDTDIPPTAKDGKRGRAGGGERP